MNVAAVQMILRQYGYEAAKLYPTQKGYRNESNPVLLMNGTQANLILYKSEPGMLRVIRNVHAVARYAVTQGVSVRVPLDDHIMQLKYATTTRYAGLYNYLSGEAIAWEAYTQKHLKALGQALGQLHTALKMYPLNDLPSVVEQYQLIIGRMVRYFSDTGVRRALRAKLGLSVPLPPLERMAQLLQVCKSLQEVQTLHMDFVRSNVLFENAPDTELGIRISGVLDFEKVAYGHRVFDIARTFAFLLVDCKYKTPAQIRTAFLRSGYIKRGKQRLTTITVRYVSGTRLLFDELTTLFLAYDFYKFLRHNPYENVSANEHFTRTRSLLLQHGVITTTNDGSMQPKTLLQ